MYGVYPRRTSSFRGVNSGFLDDTTLYPNVSGVVSGQIAAGVAASIANDSPVSETFANLIASPADGTTQTENDFFNGAAITTDGDELALSGTAGTSTNYLSGDGSADFSSQKTVGSGSILESWHRTDTGSGWFFVAFRYHDTGGSVRLFGNLATTGNGVALDLRNTDILRLRIKGDSGTVNVDTTATLTDGVDYLIFVTWDATTDTDNVKFYINSDTVTETKSAAFNTSITNSSDPIMYGATSIPSAFLGSDTRGYGWAWGSGFQGDTFAAEGRDWYQLNTPIV